MKIIIAVLSLVVVILSVSAQEPVPLEESQKIALVLTKNALEDVPLKMELNVQKPNGLRVEDVAVMVIPDKQISAATVAKADKEVLPLGQLWTLKLAPALNGKVTPNDQLRIVTVATDEREYKLPLFFLGAKKNDQGALELVVFAKNKQPLLRVPLEKAERTQELPIELQGTTTDDNSGVLTLNIAGKYKADVTLMKQVE
ncbi:MAG: hypothetical protein HY674_01805 [Chloroflexi bacterium]|nr:hypothetical protein [Chloroflexota bacterium]